MQSQLLSAVLLPLLTATGFAVRTHAQYTAADIGNPSPAGIISAAGNGYNISAGGGDIGGISDQFTFNYQAVTGDFDQKIRVSSLSLADSWTKAGLMARATLTNNSPFTGVFATPGNAGSYFISRAAVGGPATSSGFYPVNYPDTWLRLQRAGNLFTSYGSVDGENWVRISSLNITLTNTVFLGMAVTSRTNGIPATAQFRDSQSVTSGVVVPYVAQVEPPGPSSRLTPFAITEIHYNPAPDPASNVLEFIEIYNSNPFFEELSGYRITGDIEYTFPPNSFMPGNAYFVIARDPAAVQNHYGLAGVMGPYTNTLKQSGTVRLRNKENAVLLEVTYDNQPPWPVAADGAGHSLVLARPSYGERDPYGWANSGQLGGSPGRHDGVSSSPQRAVVINEFFANSEPPDEDFVELYNHSNQQLDLSGCTLSDTANTNKFVMLNGTSIPARGFLSFSQSQIGFGLSSGGETIYFRGADGRVIDTMRFQAQASGVSSGRSPDGASEVYPLQSRTPGAANAAFRVHDIVINEIMYRPVSGSDNDEYIELYNKGTSPVSLAGWRFVAGIDYTFPAGATLAPKSYLVVAENAAHLLTNYAQLNQNNTYGDYQGSLRNRGERVALAMPDISITTNGTGQVRTNTVYVVVDEVSYRNGGNWPKWANEGGSSLELIDPRSNHRLAHNWADSDETQKAPWTSVEATGNMDNGSDGPDWAEILPMNEGEYLVDNYEVIHSNTGTNYLTAANSTFESGLGNWFLRGTVGRSFIENSGGFGGGRCLHLVASARGDTMYNRALCKPIPLVPTTGAVTLRAKVRWLRGWPEMLLRLKGNWMEAYGRLAIPANLGTPGLVNSAAATNNAPALSEVTHAPVVPAANEPVVVTARVQDPDGVASVVLRYRIDVNNNFNYLSVTMRDNGADGDAVEGDGVYSGIIPAQAAGTMVAFQVTANDTLGASRLFPIQYPNWPRPFECLVRFGDPIISGGFATYRQWMSQTNVTAFQLRPALDNERMFETLVYGNFRVIYNANMKWAGSPYHQFSGSPVTTAAHYAIDLPQDDLFLGTDGLNKIHAPGNSPFDDNTAQREQFCYWMARQLGLTWNYRRFVNMFFNGDRRGGTTQMMEDTVTPGDDLVDSLFPDDNGGNLYKLQPWFEQPDPASTTTQNNRSWTELDKFTTLSNGVPVHKKARYRHNYLVRAANGTANDFDPVFELIDAAQSTNNLAALGANLSSIADMEEWFRIFSVSHSVGDWDHFGYRNSQNTYAYKTDSAKWTLMIWDMNIVLDNSGSDGAGTLTLPGNLTSVNAADSVMPYLYRAPSFRRMYLRSLKEICNSVWVTNKYITLLDAKYNAMVASGVTPTSPNSQIKPYVALARTTIRNSIATEDAANFLITSSNVVDTTNNYVVITGLAPVEAKTILVNGVEYPITWTNARSFVLYVPVTPGGSSLALQGYGINGNALPGFTTNVTVNSTAQVPPADSAIVISEIMYNPQQPEASFVEIQNRSDFGYNISGWRINGVDYTFPDDTFITNRQHLVLVKNVGAFTVSNRGVPIFGIFEGNLDKGGETISLEKPVPVYTTNGLTIVTNILYAPVNRVRYDNDPPWPTGPDGNGPSLQLIDADQDNARVSNWAAGAAWQRVTRTGNIANGTNIFLWLSQAGSCYVDDVSLSTAGGPNILINAGFESGSLAPWAAGAVYSNSTVVSGISHSGNHSLFIQGSSSGGGNNVIQQVITDSVQSNTVYTLSLYALYHTNPAIVNLRPVPGNNMTTNLVVAPIISSAGQPNLLTDVLPPYDPLWLNEVQLNNLTGMTDNNGQREPWLELFNSGTNALDLSGYYLANNYNTNLTQWQFPAGATLGPRAFRIVWLDGETAQTSGTNLHANFRLNSPTGSVALVRFANSEPQITDYLNYPVAGPDLSYGSAPDGQPFYRSILFAATPGASNSLRTVNLFINEWMAGNTNFIVDPASLPGAPENDDWFEIYNAGTEAVDLGGYFLTDNLNNRMQYQVPTNGQYVIPPGGFQLVWADGAPEQNNPNRPDLHVNFQLARGGESLGLHAPDGQTAIDTVTFGNQTNDVSQGRFADGASTLYFMTTPTPRAPNTIGGTGNNHAPVINPIADRFVSLGQTVSFLATATDGDPGQSVSFSLGAGAPGTASITPGGQFLWTPSQSGVSAAITVIATDNGLPPLNSSRGFTVTVAPPPSISINGTSVSISFPTIAGKTYRIDYKNNLNDPQWLVLEPAVVAGTSLGVIDNLGANPQRFYKIVQLD